VCNSIRQETCRNAIGEFLKGNEFEPMRMPVVVALCQCGLKHWARMENGEVWVECENAA